MSNLSPETAMIVVAAVVAFIILISAINNAAPKRDDQTKGWWPDPFGRHEYRYYDGRKWTDYVSDKGVSSVSPAIPAPVPQQYAE